jgi:hypothetical protein
MMLSQLSPILLFTVVGGLLCFPSSYASAQQESIDALRQLALEQLGPDRLGAGYAALINFAVNPDISAATFYIDVDGADNPTLNVFRLPLRHVFKPTNHTWRPFVQANFAYQAFDASLDVLEGESIDLTYRT